MHFPAVSSGNRDATRRGAGRTLENRLDNPSTNSRSHLSVPNADSRRDDDILQDDRMPAACRSGPAEL
jgi:hypothetical protein